MKRIVSIVMAFLAISVLLGAQTKVMSHRGYYAHPGSFENTLTSLRGAQELGVEGVELDVHLTTDDSLVILHGPKIAGSEYKDVQKLDFKTVRSCVLPNGDKVPTLREYFTQAKKTTALMLFLELKAHPTKERETTLAEKVVALCDEMNMYDQVTFISFSEHLCDEILRLRKGTKVIPISSSKAYTTEELLRRGYAGVSYHMGVVMNRTHLLDEAHEAGLQTVLWPVNSYDLADFAMRHHVDYVSSDEPQAMLNLMSAVRELQWKQTKKLIVFDLDGTLTQHKQPLTDANRAVLDTLRQRYEIIMAGGGNCKRIYNQMGQYPITILGNYGMEESQVIDGEFKMVREETSPVDKKFFDKKTAELRKKYGYTVYKGDSNEYHQSGMVTFALLGTKADQADKLVFDPDKIRRRAMFLEMSEIFKDYSVFIGGTTSFDITPKQYNKYDAVMRYAAEHGYVKDQILFVGDDFTDGGNDSQIRLGGMDYIRIDDYTRLPEKMSFMF
ncbi:MAG: HAD-IIB family hydrolase [Bacteroidales bacterium]|nr:HAD-IIB family hydrolase [Bacteroidales bacterium]